MSLTLAVIKPDAFSRASSIEARLRAANFAVLARATITLLPSQVAELYEDVEGTPAYSKLLKLMTSGPVVALALEKSDAVAALSALMGPEDSGVAKSEVRTPSAFPWCFPPRAPTAMRSCKQIGAAELARRVRHRRREERGARLRDARRRVPGTPALLSSGASPAPAACGRDASFPHPSPSLPPSSPPPHARSRANGVAQVFAPETTLAIVKPAAFASADQVLAAAVAEGFLVLAKSEFTLTKEQAQRAPLSLTRPPSRPPWSPGARLLRDSCATPLPRRIPQASQFYASHAGQPYFGEWVDALSGGPLLAAVLEKPFAVDEWATMLGPEDPSPGDATSLRGRFGALHGSRSLGVAASEAAFFFGDSLTKQQAAGAHATPDDAGNRHRRPPAHPPACLTRRCPPQRTFAFIKPDAFDSAEAIIAQTEAAGFSVLCSEQLALSKEQAHAFYAEHNGKPFFDGLVAFMTSGTVLAMVLQRPCAVTAWRALIGPTNSTAARESAPWSLRAKYGADGQKNACHGSDSRESAAREAAFFFPELAHTQATLALVTPDAVAGGYLDAVLAASADAGLVVTERAVVQLDEQRAAEFLDLLGSKEVLAGATVEPPPAGTFEAAVALLSSGPSVALALSGEGAVARWSAVLGPSDPHVAKVRCPGSLRARFGVDATRNVAHGSASAAAAFGELKFFFPNRLVEPLPSSKQAKEYVAETLTPALTAGLVALCRAKPTNPAEFLAHYLFENNRRAA